MIVFHLSFSIFQFSFGTSGNDLFNDKWKMENDKWKMANVWKMVFPLPIIPDSFNRTTTHRLLTKRPLLVSRRLLVNE